MDVPCVDHLGAQARDVALVDAELVAELLLRLLAPRPQHHQRVRVGDRERLTTGRAAGGECTEAPKQLLQQPPQLVALGGRAFRHLQGGLARISCERNYRGSTTKLERIGLIRGHEP